MATVSENSEPRYTVKIGDTWLPDMLGTEDTSGSSKSSAGIFGQIITDFTLGDGYTYAVRGKRGKWVSGNKYDKEANLSKGGPVTGLKIDGNVIYAVHIKGGNWLTPVNGGTEIGIGVPIDAVWIELVD